MKDFRNTKIICTIGPSSNNYETLKALVLAGMNVMRLNFSHGSHESHLACIKLLRQINQELSTHVGILLDTKGPEIRTHDFEGGSATIQKDTIVNIHMHQILGNATDFSVTYSNLINEVEVGRPILVDDGALNLSIKAIDLNKQIIITQAQNTVTIKNKRGVNSPGSRLNMQFISDQDYQDLLFGCENNVDFIAASFTRRPQDILDIKKVLTEQGKDQIQVIAKIENTEGVEKFDEILKVADGVMVARGDLGVEVPIYEIPMMQRHLLHRCIEHNKPVIIATQLLDSMQRNLTPTRAEVNDVASAVLSGSDCIMLSGETASGLYPVEAVKMMDTIARYTEAKQERSSLMAKALRNITHDVTSTVVYSAIEATKTLNIKAFVIPTQRGVTAKKLSNFRSPLPIIATSMSDDLMNKLSIYYGIHPVKMQYHENTDEVITEAITIAKAHFNLKKGDLVAITCNSPLTSQSHHANMMKIQEIE